MSWSETTPEAWREGPQDVQDTRDMGDWERAAYVCAEEKALSREKLLKLLGVGLGGLLLAPSARARDWAAPRVVRQGVTKNLIVSRGAPSTTLDPHRAFISEDRLLLPQLFDTLIYVGGDGKVYPGLATAWSFNRDGRALTFKLRRGVTFHDGTGFDASAVKFTVDRWRDPRTGSTTAAAQLGPLSQVVVVDQYTVKFLYTQPFAPVLVNLASGVAGIVSEAAVKQYGDQFGRNPVGTGAYRFVEWTADGMIRFRRNAAHTWATPYFKAANGKPLNRGASIESVEIRIIPSDETRTAAFVAREIDMLYGVDVVPTNKIAGLRKARNIQLKQVPGSLDLINLNSGRPPLNDPRCRQALSHAIDREKLVALAYHGEAKPGLNLLSSAYAVHDPTIAKFNQYDPEKATSLLAAAGKKSGFEIDILVSETTADEKKRAVQVVQEDLSKIKVKLNIKIVPTSVFVADFLNKSLGGKTNAYMNGYTLTSGADAGALLSRFLSKAGLWAMFSDRQLDALLRKQSATINPKKRRRLLVAIQRRIAQRAYALPLVERPAIVVAQNYVHNVRLDWLTQVYFQELTRD